MRVPLQRKVRRQAAKILRTLLQDDEKRESQASIRTLIYSPSVVAKKATMALTCQCLKYLPILKEILEATDLLNGKHKIPEELILVLTCELLFGQEVVCDGNAENTVLSRKTSLRSALARLLVTRNVSSVENLLLPLAAHGTFSSFPRYVRVNTLKTTVEETLCELKHSYDVKQDDLIPELLVLPARTDLHKHPLVLSGAVFLQGKASCMPAQALAPQEGWEVIDACAAPGNKTVQLAALMHGTGRVWACELNLTRLERLRQTTKLARAFNVEILHTDFLRLNPCSPDYSKVRAVLLDPSCSGSGTTLQRFDHLLPSSFNGSNEDGVERKRVENLARFQETALTHALSFPSVERVVYSTCSVHQRENEDVIKAVLPYAATRNFHLETLFPQWPHRGLDIFDGAHHLLRTEASRDQMDGFFIALFVRSGCVVDDMELTSTPQIGEEKNAAILSKSEKIDVGKKLSILRRRKLKRNRKKRFITDNRQL